MKDMWYLVRFFRVVAPVPPLMLWTFGVSVTLGVVMVLLDPQRATSALAPILLLQLFAASSGFAAPARRGFYDLLLTRGDGRLRIALVHWALSIAPGILGWLAIAAAEVMTRPAAESIVVASGTCAAMFVLSTLPWAITTPLPRFAGGVGWLLVLVMVASLVSPGARGEQIWPGGLHPWIPSSIVFLIYPAGTVGRHLGGADVWTVAPAMLVAVCSMIAAARWIVRADYPLEAAQ
jgi:hypothetical protein